MKAVVVVGGGFWRLEMRLGRVLGYGNAFGVESGPECWGEGVPPPPLFKRFPAPSPCLVHGPQGNKTKTDSGNNGTQNQAPLITAQTITTCAIPSASAAQHYRAVAIAEVGNSLTKQGPTRCPRPVPVPQPL